MLALLIGYALGRQELASLDVETIQMREARWVRANFEGKGRRVRMVDLPIWVKYGINAWMTAAGIEDGRLLRSIRKGGKKIGEELSDGAIWSVVEQEAKKIGIEQFGAHDLRRTCAKLCRKAGDISNRSSSCWHIRRSRPQNVLSVRSRRLRSRWTTILESLSLRK
jgi:integrase